MKGVSAMQTVLQIETWDTNRITPYARNPRRNDDAVDRMCGSLNEFGFRIPLLVRGDGELIDGHLRWKAAKKLGLKTVPVVRCDDWTPAQVKAFRLLVNRSASWAEWDVELVAIELADLQEFNFDLTMTGFDPPEIDAFIGSSCSEEKADVVPDVPSTPVSRPGDIWLCGQHRISCGDSTCESTVKNLLQSATPTLMVTDPPYGVNYDPRWRAAAGLGAPRQTGTITNDQQVDWTASFRLFSGDVGYVWHAGLHAGEVAAGLMSLGFVIRSQIVWAKQHFALSRGDYHWQHEPAWYVVRRGRSAHWRGDRTQSTLWQVRNLNPFGGGDRDEPITGHGAQKPVELMKRPILNHTERAEAVYDPFLGAGTTLIASELTGRVCLGVEIEPGYVDVTVNRWQQLSQSKATLEGTDRSFAEIALDRLGPAREEG
jgi:DNA modification methylase